MKPDLVLQGKPFGQLIILDTKFTAKSLIGNQWGKERFDSSHLYQMYAYLSTQAHLSEKHQQAIGILLYPTVRNELSEKVELQNHQIYIESVNLAAPWQDIEDRLLEMIANRTGSNSINGQGI